MKWPVALNTKTRRVFALFALAEITLIIAVPFLVVAGVHTLLGSRVGIFVPEVGPGEPGWRAQVEPSSAMVVVEQFQGETVGVALATHKHGVDGGFVALMPSQIKVGDSTFEELSPEEIGEELSTVLSLRIDQILVVDENAWSEVLGDQTYAITNPDRVRGIDGFKVGSLTLDGDNTGRYVGLKDEDADPDVLFVRRELVWNSLVDQPPVSNHPLGEKIDQLAGGPVDIFQFPTSSSEDTLDATNVEELLRRAVPFPAGAVPEHRVRVRILDRTGSVDLLSIAAQMGAEGIEVVEVGTTTAFDDGPSELFLPSEWIGPNVAELEDYLDLSVQVEQVNEPESIATIVVGDDFSLLST